MTAEVRDGRWYPTQEEAEEMWRKVADDAHSIDAKLIRAFLPELANQAVKAGVDVSRPSRSHERIRPSSGRSKLPH